METLINWKILDFPSDDAQYLWREVQGDSDIEVFNDYLWLKTWFDFLGKAEYRAKPRVVCLFKGNIPIEVWPLASYTKIPKGSYGSVGVTSIRWLGYPEADYSGPIGESYRHDPSSMDEELVACRTKAIVAVARNADFICLDKTRPTLTKEYFCHEENINVTSYLGGREMRLSVEAPAWNAVSKRIRSDTRRSWLQLQGRNKVSFEPTVRSEQEVEVVAWILARQLERFGAAKKTRQFSRRQDFYCALLGASSKKWKAELSVLRANGEIIAAHLGLRSRTTFYYLLPAITSESRWVKYSPGRQLMRLLVERSEIEGLRRFDLGSAFHPWKLSFDQRGTGLSRIYGAQTWPGRIYLKRITEQLMDLPHETPQGPIEGSE